MNAQQRKHKEAKLEAEYNDLLDRADIAPSEYARRSLERSANVKHLELCRLRRETVEGVK